MAKRADQSGASNTQESDHIDCAASVADADPSGIIRTQISTVSHRNKAQDNSKVDSTTATSIGFKTSVSGYRKAGQISNTPGC